MSRQVPAILFFAKIGLNFEPIDFWKIYVETKKRTKNTVRENYPGLEAFSTFLIVGYPKIPDKRGPIYQITRQDMYLSHQTVKTVLMDYLEKNKLVEQRVREVVAKDIHSITGFEKHMGHITILVPPEPKTPKEIREAIIKLREEIIVLQDLCDHSGTVLPQPGNTHMVNCLNCNRILHVRELP